MSTDNEQRRVFGPYFDGAETVYGDPHEIYRELQASTGGCLRQVVRDARLRGPDDAINDDEETCKRKLIERSRCDIIAFPAIRRLLAAALTAFRLVPFDRTTGKGATEAVCNKVLADYFEFLSTEKKTPGSTPME